MATQRTVRLLKNHLYPTYQLYAHMGSKKTPPKDGLRLGALIAMDWLRQRLGEDIPGELQAVPGPEQYQTIDSHGLPSLHINQGFVIDIVSMPEDGIWSLQITEPDLGSDPGNPEQLREAVAGRVIETNIAFHIQDRKLECGFQTVISDPDGAAEKADVYRLAVVHKLIQHPDFGLKHGAPLGYAAAPVTSAGQLDTMLKLCRDENNQLPCVVFTRTKPRQEIPSFPEWKPAVGLRPSVIPDTLVEAVSALPYDIEAFAKGGVTYCHSFLLADPLLERFQTQSRLSLQPGDIAVLEPVCFGGKRTVLPYRPGAARQREVMETLRQKIYTYPREREASFGGITFLSAARENLLYTTEAVLQQSKTMSEEWRQELAHLKLQWNAELQKRDKEKQALEEQLGRQRLYISRIEQEKEQLRIDHAHALAQMQAVVEKRDGEIEYLRRKLGQPKSHSEIASWAEANFSDHLILHPRAIKCLEDRDARTVDIGLICDALDFLATDYWERRYLRISDDEMKSRCSQKYGRPFDVTPIGSTTIEYTPIEYKIKYFVGAQGKRVESPLDYHLRVGNDSENLLRIYFLHDDARQLVVIGSLPKHLRAVTFKA